MESGRQVGKIALLTGDLDNVGDALLARAEAVYLRSLGYSVVVLPYAKPAKGVAEGFAEEEIDVVPIRSAPWRSIRAAIGGHVFIGGGHAIRESLTVVWMVFAIFLASVARFKGRAVVISGVGVSLISKKIKFKLARAIFWLATSVCVRDEKSKINIENEFGRKGVKRFTDLAFLNGCDFLSDVDPSVAVVSPAYDIYEQRSGDHEQIKDAILFLVRHHGVKTIRIVAHDSRTDLESCAVLFDWVKEECAVECILFPPVTLQKGNVQPYRKAGFVVTGRLHGLILGLLNGGFVAYTDASAKKLRPFGDISGCLPLSQFLEAGAIPDVDRREFLSSQKRLAIECLESGLI